MARNTQQKRVLRELFKEAGRPLSAQELWTMAKVELPQVGLATIYRNIKEFLAEGLLKEVELPGDAMRYESASLPHHHFFHCRSCEKVYDVPGCPSGLRSLVPKGFLVESHELIYYGHCLKCS